MTLAEIKHSLIGLSRSEKYELVQCLVEELEKEEEWTSNYLKGKGQAGFWSQHNADEAAEKLQILLDKQIHQ